MQPTLEPRGENRKPATTKGYRKGLACWAAFCGRRKFTDNDLVHEKKVLFSQGRGSDDPNQKEESERNKRRAPNNGIRVKDTGKEKIWSNKC
jgi:hypothetical protein